MTTLTNSPDETTRRALMRLVHGELPEAEARELARRAQREPALAAERARLEAVWEFLELPPVAPVPADFSVRVAQRAEALRGEAVSWSLAPAWVRAAAVAALAAGLLLGVGAGFLEPREAAAADSTEWSFESGETSLADAYWQALEEGSGAGEGEGDGATTPSAAAAPEEG